MSVLLWWCSIDKDSYLQELNFALCVPITKNKGRSPDRQEMILFGLQAGDHPRKAAVMELNKYEKEADKLKSQPFQCLTCMQDVVNQFEYLTDRTILVRVSHQSCNLDTRL